MLGVLSFGSIASGVTSAPKQPSFLDTLLTTGAGAASGNPMAAISGISSIISGLFSNKPNPNDWAGWAALDNKIGAPKGTNAQNWIINDGDSIQNEALNITKWIENYGIETVVNYSSWFKRNITLDDLYNKLNKAGYSNEVQQIKNSSSPFSVSGLISPNKDYTNYLVIGAIGIAAFFLFKKK